MGKIHGATPSLIPKFYVTSTFPICMDSLVLILLSIMIATPLCNFIIYACVRMKPLYLVFYEWAEMSFVYSVCSWLSCPSYILDVRVGMSCLHILLCVERCALYILWERWFSYIYSAWGMFQDWVHKSGEVEIKRPMTQRVGGFPWRVILYNF